MKYIIPLIFTLALLGCESKKEKLSEVSESDMKSSVLKDSKEIENTPTNLNFQVALDFLNAYIKHSNDSEDGLDMVQWTRASPLATDKFKTELLKLVNEAWKEDPEIGLGFDPIFDAQDYPDEGVELLDFDSETGYLVVKGIKWDSFNVTMKIVHQNGQTMVEGCGVINIPEEKRAER